MSDGPRVGSFEPRTPDDLLWSVSRGAYGIVHDPVRFRPELRQSLRKAANQEAKETIAALKTAGGVCPECSHSLPVFPTLRERKRFDIFQWHCAQCGWRRPQEPGRYGGLRTVREFYGIQLLAHQAELEVPRGMGEWARWTVRCVKRQLIRHVWAVLVGAGLCGMYFVIRSVLSNH